MPAACITSKKHIAVYYCHSHPGVHPPSHLIDALLLRASRLMPEFTGSEMSDMVAGLARLQYRPSDAWLKLFTQQVRKSDIFV
jgi:hypothetical protein